MEWGRGVKRREEQWKIPECIVLGQWTDGTNIYYSKEDYRGTV